jgi:hypothetical protein
MVIAEKTEPAPRRDQGAPMCLYVRDMLEQLGKIASDLHEDALSAAISTAVEEARRTVDKKMFIAD